MPMPSDEADPTGATLSAEDQARLTRLYEEIVGRYVEVSLIKGRAIERTN